MFLLAFLCSYPFRAHVYSQEIHGDLPCTEILIRLGTYMGNNNGFFFYFDCNYFIIWNYKSLILLINYLLFNFF